MNKNIIQFIVDENGQYISIPVGRVKAKSNLTTRIQLVTPITASTAVNYLIYDSKNINKKQYLIPTGDLGSAVVDPNNSNYQLVAGWKVYEADIYAPILSVISKYRTGKVGMSFEFVEQVPNALCTNFVDYFGFTKELPETASNGDYYICEDYNFWLNDKLYNKGDILVWYNEQWNDGGVLPKALTETVDISVDPAISYPTEEVDETAFGNAIGELAEDVAELDTRLNGVETNLNGKQDKVDLGLNTTSKTVVGGINEVKAQEEVHYNTLNTNKLDKNFNLLVERTFSQLTDWVAVRSGSDTLKMSLETLRTYLTQGLVGLSFVLIDELPPTGVLGVIYLTPMVTNVERVATVEELPITGELDTIYIVEADNSRYQWNGEEYEAYNQGYEEWVWLEELDKYELIGTTKIDLTGYATEIWVTENFTTKSEFSGLVESLNGGTTGQILTKKSDSDLDVEWTDIEMPTISVNGIDYLKDPAKTYLVIKTPADNDTFELLTGSSGSPDYTIEWGDGISESVTTTDNPTHEYAKAGMYLITISGSFANGIVTGIASNVNKNKIIEVYGGSNYPTTIDTSAFRDCQNLTTANIPQATTISEYAFYGCQNLTTVNLPLVTSIDTSAFRDCQNLTTANIPNVTSIDGYAFYGCQNLTTVNLPLVTSIDTSAFRDCTNLTTANIPQATSIGFAAFLGCTNLTTANFPNATSIGSYAFNSCTNLTTAHFPNITSVSGYAFLGCTNLTTANFPNATSIDTSAFNSCTNLTTANFPNVTSIGKIAFANCTSLKELTLGNVTTTSTGTRFQNVKLINLIIAQDVTDIDIQRIKTFYANNGGTFSNSYELKHGLQVEKIPTLDNDAVRNIDLETVKNLIPTQINRYFTETTQTLYSKSFRVMQQDKPTDPIANIDTTITATTQATAQVLSRFTTTDGVSSEINLPPQNTEVNIEALRTAGIQNVRIFARGFLMDDAGNETLLSTSNVATLTSTSGNYILQLPIPAYTAPAGSRAVIEILAYRVSGTGTHTARIRVNDDTMSKWSYNLSLADLKLDAKNITYKNTTSGLTATNVQNALDELTDTKQDELVSGVNIRTVNNISLLGSGDITVSGGGAINGVDYLKDPDKTYLVIKTPADDDMFTLLTGTTGSPNYVIEWGDGISETITTTDNPTHEYAKAGMYLITISGSFANGIVVGNTSNANKNKIIEVYGGSNYPTIISENAFSSCTNLTTVNIPNVTSIDDYAFQSCTNLTTANLPNVTSILLYAFRYCTNLTTVNIPNVTSIDGYAFQNCTNLITANFPKLTSIGSNTFNGCTNLITANFPKLTSIGSAFNNCTNLTTVNLPLVTSILGNAFNNCTSLKELTLGNVTTTDTGTRFEDVKLVNLIIAQDVTNTDIDRIKQFYADNGGTFTGAQINSI